MPAFCAVVNCGTTGGHGYSMYRFPSKYDIQGKICPLSSERLAKWIKALRRADVTESKIKYERVCSRHFISGKKAELEDVSNPDWVPSINMGYQTQPSSDKDSAVKRFKRAQKRTYNKIVLETKTSEPQESQRDTEEPADDIRSSEELLEAANNEISLLKSMLSKYKYNRETLKADSVKCAYYTGFPDVKYIDIIFALVEPYLTETHASVLPKYEQLVLTLMKLRKNFDYTEIGYKFQIDRRTASRCFQKCLFVLYRRLKTFIIWPSREILQQTMPLEFKLTFGSKVATIIDCFEVFCEKPSTQQAASKTFSQYKHHHTIKFLIGITPRGNISFISEAYGGRASDKFITENSGFLDNLLPGDAVLADRGFLIADTLKMCMAEVIAPAFLNGKKQLAPEVIEKTRSIAHLRIHVERVIGSVKQKFSILSATVPITLLNDKNAVCTVDQIATVCCALTNLCPSIVTLA